MSGPLSSVMMTATAGMLPQGAADPNIGTSLAVSANLTSAISSYTALPVIQQYTAIMTAAVGNVVTANTRVALQTMAGNTLPALTNAIPSAQAGNLQVIAPGGVFSRYSAGNVFVGGFSGLISNTAINIMGSGDVSRFAQIYTAAEGYAAQCNQFINTNLNVGTVESTFGPQNGGMDNLTTGGFNQVTQAFGALGQDLQRLGQMINLKDLKNLGSPASLVRQVINLAGAIPVVTQLLQLAGVTVSQVRQSQVIDSADRLLYQAMLEVTGDRLAQVCAVLGVTLPVGGVTDSSGTRVAATANTINTMADLLDPVRILPNSFYALTMPTPDGLRAIYATSTGAINTRLAQYLPESALSKIIPPDQAVANMAISHSLQQVKRITDTTLPQLAQLLTALESNTGLGLVQNLTTPVPAAVSVFWGNTFATGSGSGNTLTIDDMVGVAAGATTRDRMPEVVANVTALADNGQLVSLTANTGNPLSSTNGVYTQMSYCLGNVYGVPVVIPATPYFAGGTFANIDAAFSQGNGLIAAANSAISSIASANPGQAANINQAWSAQAQQLVVNQNNLTAAGVDIGNIARGDWANSNVISNLQSASLGLGVRLHAISQDIEPGGAAQFFEQVANIAAVSGQAVVASLREGRNIRLFNSLGLGIDSQLPDSRATQSASPAAQAQQTASQARGNIIV